MMEMVSDFCLSLEGKDKKGKGAHLGLLVTVWVWITAVSQTIKEVHQQNAYSLVDFLSRGSSICPSSPLDKLVLASLGYIHVHVLVHVHIYTCTVLLRIDASLE